ncbi:MAG: outer membrane protein transport protein, partial [Calditerrivibrio sp.]|nr:outer membrane protein transport protein [Calditerrivibrio sp.]
MKKLLMVIAISGLCASAVLANGFQINEQGAKSLGMGGAFVAQADDPSAVYFNPAGMAFMDGIQLSLGVSPIMPRATFDSAGTAQATTGKSAGETDSKKPTFFIPNFYYTQKMGEKFAFGVGVFANFGLATEWPKDWEGRFTTGGTKAEITTISLNPNISYKVSDKLSIGGGIVFQKADITLENRIKIFNTNTTFALSSEGDSVLKADSTAWGWNLGLLYKPNENWSFGASYRSKIKQKLEGHGEHTKLDNTTSFYQPYFQHEKTPGKANLTLPDIAYIGAAWTNQKWTFELDGQWTGWSSYDKLEVKFDGTYLNQSVISKPKG